MSVDWGGADIALGYSRSQFDPKETSVMWLHARRISACCAFAATDPVPPRPVLCVASSIGVEPFLFTARASAPAIEESLYGGSATGTDGAVQGRDTALVHDIRICTCRDEACYRRCLRIWIPSR